MSAPRVLLVTMPWRAPFTSCLALETLRPVLADQEGLAADLLYGSLLFPRDPRSTSRVTTLVDQFSSILFLPHLYPGLDLEALWDATLRRYREECVVEGEAFDASPELFGEVVDDVARAGVCLDRCVARVLDGADDGAPYDVVGLSMTFETQAAATFALARRLKQARPSLHIVLGGAGCLGEQARGFVASFPELDAACHAEGEGVIGPLVRALRAGDDLANVPGIAYRAADGRVRRTTAPPNLPSLDALPLPDYGPFLAQHADSEWRHTPPNLYFETSRGCSWGEKKPCHFCGFNAERRAHRTKSPERAFAELERLVDRFPGANSYNATDNILDSRYFDTLFPRLAELRAAAPRPFRLFYEVRTSVQPEQVAAMADAGVWAIQTGVESFDDAVLRLMNKGVTALTNIQLIRHAYEQGIRVLYNILLGTPGEDAAAYERMCALLPAIRHLPPPIGVQRMMLDRFSAYYERPADFGLTNLRPHEYYDTLYREPTMDRARMAYHFAYDGPRGGDDPALAAARNRFAAGVADWARAWSPNRAYAMARHGSIVLHDHRFRREPEALLDGQAAVLFRHLDRVRTWPGLRRHFPDWDEATLRATLDSWVRRRWALRDGRDRYLVVLPVLRDPKPR